MSADLTDSVVSAKTQTSSSTVSVDDILQEANQIKKEQHLPIATSQDDDENSWTLAIYMCGSDLERDKAAGTRDLCEMLCAQHKMEGDNRDLDNLNLIVMTGGAGNDLWRPGSEETEPINGWDYYWLEIFAEIKEKNTPSGEQSEIIGKRIVDLYPGDKIVDKKDHSQLDDVERAKGIWEGRDPDFTNGTLALIDLRRIDTLMQAMGELGTALNNIYVDKDTNRRRKRTSL